MRETLRFSGKILSATISRVANQWFVSIAPSIARMIRTGPRLA
jgi:putative transposase